MDEAQTHLYPELPLPSEGRRYLKSAIWILFAGMVHLSVYFVADRAAEIKKTYAHQKNKDADNHFVIIHETPKPEPMASKERPESEPPSPVLKKSLTQNIPPKEALPRKKQVLPAAQEAPAPPSSENKPAFVDMGVMGSVDIGATGSGGSFAVAVGDSGVGGPIGTGGRVTGKASPGGILREPPSPTPRKMTRIGKVTAVRDLSRKANPVDAHNRKLKAPYPQELREVGLPGEVKAVLTVLADGTVGNVKIVKSTHDAFKSAAVSVFKKFLFDPAIDKEGNAVITKVNITYRFTLE